MSPFRTALGSCWLLALTATAVPSLAQRAAQPPPRHTPSTPHAAPRTPLPQLGDELPAALLKRAATAKPCDVGDNKTDPCITISQAHDHITVAWDASTHRVTYLYSTTLDTDNDIRTGDLLAIDPDSPITPFATHGSPHRFVTIDWCDTDRDLSGEALWCAVMVPARPRSGKVVGFVQSLYLYLPEWEPEPMHHVSLQDPLTGAAR